MTRITLILKTQAETAIFGTPTATADGFTVQISNYSALYTWAGTATASGSVAISGSGLVTVTGVSGSTSSTATITTTRTGYVSSSATVTATSLDPFATLVSTMSTGFVAGFAKATTGYIKVTWWDNTTNVYGTGVAGSSISWSKAAGGVGSKTIRIYPSDVSGNLSGALTYLICENRSLTSLNVSGLTALTTLYCHSNSLTSLNVSGLTALTVLYCTYNSLTSLDVSGLTALTSLYCHSNSLTSLNVGGLTALTYLECSINSLTSLNVSGLTALATLYCTNNSLTSLNVSGLTALKSLYCGNNSLTSLRAVGVVFDTGYYKKKKAEGIQSFVNNSLNAAALNQFYTDLAATTPGTGFLDVGSNPGTSTDNPAIATAKGYVVFNS